MPVSGVPTTHSDSPTMSSSRTSAVSSKPTTEAILFAWHGYATEGTGGVRALVGRITHLSDDPRYRRLNDTVAVVTGEVGHGQTATAQRRRSMWRNWSGKPPTRSSIRTNSSACMHVTFQDISRCVCAGCNRQ
jgi:hypothetical protein